MSIVYVPIHDPEYPPAGSGIFWRFWTEISRIAAFPVLSPVLYCTCHKLATCYLWGGEGCSPGSAHLIFSAVLWPFPLIDVTIRACLYCQTTTAHWLITHKTGVTWSFDMNIQAHVSSCLYLSGEEQPGGASSKNPRGHLSNTSRCKSEGEEHQLWNEDNWTVLQKEKLNFFLHCWQLQCKWLVWGRHWQYLKGIEQNSPLEEKKKREIFEKNE